MWNFNSVALLHLFTDKIEYIPDHIDTDLFLIWESNHCCQKCCEELPTSPNKLCRDCDSLCDNCNIIPDNPFRCPTCLMTICDTHKYTCFSCEKISCCSSCQDNVIPNRSGFSLDIPLYICKTCDPYM